MKQTSDFYNRGDGKGVKAQCRACTKIARQIHYSNPDKKEMKYASDIKRLYGTTPEDVLELYTLQKNSCGICNKQIKLRDFHTHIGHCHATGKVRGVLCSKCNLMLGNCKDDIRILSKAIAYLKEHNE